MSVESSTSWCFILSFTFYQQLPSFLVLKNKLAFFSHATLCYSAVYGMAMCLSVCVCVCLYLSVSVTTRCSTKADKYKIMKIKLHDSLETLVFLCQRSTRNSTRVNPCGGARCSWGGLKQRLLTNSWLYLENGTR